MTHSPALPRLALLAAGLVGLAGRLPAQEVPRLVVSPDPKPPLARTTNIVLRPNADAPFSVYVENPGGQTWANLTVRVTADEDGNRPIVEGSVETVGPNKTVRVPLRPAVPPGTPPAAPPA